jgi:ceramide glucosyltransferase
MTWPILLSIFAGFALGVQGLAAVLAMVRLAPRRPGRGRTGTPGITVVRPVCGVDYRTRETLASTFALDYPDCEILFCVAESDDPVVALVEDLIAAHPGRQARLLVGRDRIGANPKLNNMLKGWAAARHDWIVFFDSNVMLPPDALHQLLEAWRSGTGLVSAPPVGTDAEGFWAEVEAAFLNTHQAKVQYAVAALGRGFAQGKTLFLRRSDFDKAGGIRALASEPAEDAAATKVVRSLGLRVTLSSSPSFQPIGPRKAAQVWKRQLRWARLRRATFPHLFVPEILGGALPPLLALAGAAASFGLSPLWVLAYALVWYATEAALAVVARWPLSRLSPLAWLMRDAMAPAVWAAAWMGRGFEWRGNAMEAFRPEMEEPARP